MKVTLRTFWPTSLYCILLSCIAYAKDICPPKEQLLPCICEQNVQVTSIRCSKIAMMETLVNVFERSGDRRFKFFSLDDSSLMYLPSASLESKRFKGLLIANVTLTSLFDRVPSAANDLEILTLSHAFLQRGVRWELFETLSKLTLLQLVKTEVKSLGKSFMKNIGKKITHLFLHNTKTSQLDDRVFESLTLLTDLHFTDNTIKNLKRSMFSRPAAIKNFIFTDNQIESLPKDIFSDMPSLKMISLENNKISTFTKSIFEGVYDQLIMLNIINNPINCDCSIEWFMSKVDRQVTLGTCGKPSDKAGKRMSDIVQPELDYCHDSPARGINSVLATLHL